MDKVTVVKELFEAQNIINDFVNRLQDFGIVVEHGIAQKIDLFHLGAVVMGVKLDHRFQVKGSKHYCTAAELLYPSETMTAAEWVESLRELAEATADGSV